MMWWILGLWFGTLGLLALVWLAACMSAECGCEQLKDPTDPMD